MYYDGFEIIPQTEGLLIIFDANCNESIKFSSDGLVNFPGINSATFEANWKIANDSLIITEMNDGNHIKLDEQLNVIYHKHKNNKLPYLGTFYCEIKNNILKIRNNHLLIFAKADQKLKVNYIEDEY